jgi:cell division protein FtsQ
MQQVMHLKPREEAKKSPGPSRLAYRISRAWKKAWVRRSVLLLVPVACVSAIAWQIVTSPGLRDAFTERKAAMIAELSERPEFAVREVRVNGASEELTREIQELVALSPGMSSLTMDVAAIQAQVSQLGAVRSAQVTLSSAGVLEVAVTERVAVALWRDVEDQLWLVDVEGASIAPAMTRQGYPNLPVVLGEAAPQAMEEALRLFNSVPDLQPRVRAMVRVGGRRWDIALDRDLTIMLPETGPLAALDRVIAWHLGEDLLDRDLAAIDMRLPERPTLRMTEEGVQKLRLRNAADGGREEET